MCQNNGGDNEPVIYSVPTSVVTTMQNALAETDTSSVSFTDNGSLYLSSLNQVGAEQGAASVTVLGVSGTNGAITGVNVDNITMDSSVNAASGASQLSLVFHLTEPLRGDVQFVFDVNANAVVLRSASPIADPLAAGLDLATVWCITKAGGAAILPALVTALPSLAGGPQAYLAAVTAAMPGAAIQTVQSIIANCFH